jgi:hypothetical protein
MYPDIKEWAEKINDLIVFALDENQRNELEHLLSEFHTQAYEEGYENAKEIFGYREDN